MCSKSNVNKTPVRASKKIPKKTTLLLIPDTPITSITAIFDKVIIIGNATYFYNTKTHENLLFNIKTKRLESIPSIPFENFDKFSVRQETFLDSLLRTVGFCLDLWNQVLPYHTDDSCCAFPSPSVKNNNIFPYFPYNTNNSCCSLTGSSVKNNNIMPYDTNDICCSLTEQLNFHIKNYGIHSNLTKNGWYFEYNHRRITLEEVIRTLPADMPFIQKENYSM